MKSFSNTLLLIFLICCVIATSNETLSKFSVEYEWTFVNYTWSNPRMYRNAIKTQTYIPQNNVIGGIKYYKYRIYLAISRLCLGTPVTVGYISTNDKMSKTNPLVTPFPDWKSNDLTIHTCDKLQSVQSMEIDPNGIMWIIDGHRTNPAAKCPPKLVLYDLDDKFKIVWSYTFPEKICSTKGGYLDDIVVDGDYAYITDFSMIDPGLIVVSKKEERSWKFRDSTMFAEIRAAPFVVDGTTVTLLAPIDGIALSPQRDSKHKNVYYSAVTGLSLYSINTTILENESLCASGQWRYNVTYVGEKQGQSDGMIMDNKGNLYYGLIPSYGVGKWDTHEPFCSSGMIAQNRSTMIWPDSFAFDNKGYLYLLTNHIYTYFLSPDCKFSMPEEVVFRILKLYTGTKSYLY